MKFGNLRLAILLLAITLITPMGAIATTIDFSTLGPTPLGGDLGSATYVDPGTGLTVGGLWLDDAIWMAANLYVRNQTNDHGFGVCSPADDPPCPGPNGGGDFNELDNEGANELLRLTLPAGYEWVSVQLSSLDNNGGSSFEYGELWADLDGDPTSLDTVLLQFLGNGPVEPTFLVPASAATSPYLFFRPYDWSPGGLNTNNDFLVYAVTIIEPPRDTPEPATLSLLAIGVLALGALRRKS
jgi:PEP-CTERM motif